jgi:hypothetical protein
MVVGHGIFWHLADIDVDDEHAAGGKADIPDPLSNVC